MNYQQARLFGILKDRTRANPIKRRDALAMYNAGLGDDDRIDDRQLRIIKSELLCIERVPVCSGGRGYFIGTTRDDIEIGCHELHAKAMAMLSEERILRECRASFVGDQARLL